MTINFHQENSNLENKKIFLKNLNSGLEIIKEIHENEVMFTFDELSINEGGCQNCIPTISAILCSGGENPCSGYLFYFPLDKRFGDKIKVDLFPVMEYQDTNFSPTSTCSDVNLIYCSQFIFSPDKKYSSPIQHQWGNFLELNGVKTCNNLEKIPVVEGLYFFEAFCSDGLNSVLTVQPYFQKIINIENPYDDHVIAKVNLSKTSCTFKDGSKIGNYSLNPNESLPEIISCFNKDEDATKIEINILQINNPSFSLVSIAPTLINISLIGGISFFIFLIYKKIKGKIKIQS